MDMHWNIRVVNCPSENGGDDFLTFKEVFYEDDIPSAYTEPFICSETKEGLEEVLKHMQEALQHPTLHENHFKGELK